jgi:hypothetical protein
MTHDDLHHATAAALWAQGRIRPSDLTDTERDALLTAAAECGPDHAVEAFLEGDLTTERQ